MGIINKVCKALKASINKTVEIFKSIFEREDGDEVEIIKKNEARKISRREESYFVPVVEFDANGEAIKTGEVKFAGSPFSRAMFAEADILGVDNPIVNINELSFVGEIDEVKKEDFMNIEHLIENGVEMFENEYVFFCSTPSKQKKAQGVFVEKNTLCAVYERRMNMFADMFGKEIARGKAMKSLATTMSSSENTGIVVDVHVCKAPRDILSWSHYEINAQNERELYADGEKPFEHKTGDGQSILIIKRDGELFKKLKAYFGFIPTLIQLRDEFNTGVKTIALVIDSQCVCEFINDAAKASGIKNIKTFGCGFDPREEGLITTGDCLKIPGDNRTEFRMMLSACKVGDGQYEFGHSVSSQVMTWLFGVKGHEDEFLEPLVKRLKKPFASVDAFAESFIGKPVQLVNYNGNKLYRIVGMTEEETIKYASTMNDKIAAALVLYPDLVYNPHVQSAVQSSWASLYMNALAGKIYIPRCGYFFLFEDPMYFLAKCIITINEKEIPVDGDWMRDWRVIDIYCAAFLGGSECASWRNPFTSVHGFVRFKNVCGSKFHKHFKYHKDCVFAKAGHQAYRRWMADNDGDEVAISDFKPFVEAVERSLDVRFKHNLDITGRVTVVFDDVDNTAKATVNAHSITEDLANTFISNLVGKIATLISKMASADPDKIDLRMVEFLEMLENYSIDAAKRGTVVTLDDTVMRLMKQVPHACWREFRNADDALEYLLFGNALDKENTGVINAIGNYLKEKVGYFTTDFPKVAKIRTYRGSWGNVPNNPDLNGHHIGLTKKCDVRIDYGKFHNSEVEFGEEELYKINRLLFGDNQGKEGGKQLWSVDIGEDRVYTTNRPCDMMRGEALEIVRDMFNAGNDEFVALYESLVCERGFKEVDACLRAMFDTVLGADVAQGVLSYKAFEARKAYRQVSFETLMRLYGAEVVVTLCKVHGYDCAVVDVEADYDFDDEPDSLGDIN